MKVDDIRSQPPRLPERLQSLATLAALLERLEHQPHEPGAPGLASADQFRAVARQIAMLLEQAEPGVMLDAVLAAAPATAEIYENMRYAQAGLCRTSLETALNAELAAATAISRARLKR